MLTSNVLGTVHRGQAPTLTQLGVEAHGGAVLIGAQGSEYVASLLRSRGPNAAVQELQAKYGLQQQLCKPLLQMLDLLDLSRRDAHLYLLNKARKLLLDWVAASRSAAQPCSSEGGFGPESQEDIELQEKLERLLNASFKYMGVPELKQVGCFAGAPRYVATHREGGGGGGGEGWTPGWFPGRHTWGNICAQSAALENHTPLQAAGLVPALSTQAIVAVSFLMLPGCACCV
jgi:hypothetical protein